MDSDDGSITRWSSAFGVLSDPTRLRILLLLREAGPMTTGDLVREAELTRETVSYALRLLRMYGVVEAQRMGREVRYHLTPHIITDVLSVTGIAAPAVPAGT